MSNPGTGRNLYRYIIARWGYSPSILWMTVSELDGYTVQPFDTWEGNPLTEMTAQASGGQLTIALPAFRNDIALELVGK